MEIVKVYIPDDPIGHLIEPLFTPSYIDRVEYIVCGYKNVTVNTGVFEGCKQILFTVRVEGEKMTMGYGFTDSIKADRKFMEIVKDKKIREISVEKYLEEIKNKD